MTVRPTTAQMRIIRAAHKTHGMILFNGASYSAYQQDKITDGMVAAGLVVPGTNYITSQALRAAEPELVKFLHISAHVENVRRQRGTTFAWALDEQFERIVAAVVAALET